jgi:hypothetical protein
MRVMAFSGVKENWKRWQEGAYQEASGMQRKKATPASPGHFSLAVTPLSGCCRTASQANS